MKKPPSIPASDLDEFAALPQSSRIKIIKWLGVIARIGNNPLDTDTLDDITALLGVSPKTLFAKLREWEINPDWRIFLPEVYPSRPSVQLPAEFIAYWRGMVEAAPGQTESSHRRLSLRWQQGHDIPGYATRPPAGPTGLPEGWSYRNLLRLIPSDHNRLKPAKGFFIKPPRPSR